MKKTMLLALSVAVLGLLLVGCTTESSSGGSSSSKEKGRAADFKIVKSEPANLFNGIKRKIYRVTVDPNITEGQARATIDKIIAERRKKEPGLSEMSIFLYGDKKHIGGPRTLAVADWAPSGEWGASMIKVAAGKKRSKSETSYDIHLPE